MNGTSQKTLVQFHPDINHTGYQDILLAPRMDGLMAIKKDGSVIFWEFSVPHPETTFRTLFQKVWYQGYREPTYTWQSSAATDDYESKLSLIPLIFGTIKAAFYSLLFAIGFAVIPIIYTIAEDALNAVPEHLRAASLGCGATPWQTAVHVVLPTAVSQIVAGEPFRSETYRPNREEMASMGESVREQILADGGLAKRTLYRTGNFDLDEAFRVLTLDGEVDHIHGEIYDQVKGVIRENPLRSGYLINLLLISRHLERLADHATNIAEEVIYLIEGEIVRHSKWDHHLDREDH